MNNNSSIPDDNTNNNDQLRVTITNLIKIFRTPILSLNLAVLLLQICMSTIKCFCLFHTSLIHPNLKFALLWQSACFCIYSLARTLQILMVFAIGPGHLFDGMPIQYAISFGELFSNFMGHVLLVERAFATINAKNYENWKNPYFSIVWYTPIFLITTINAWRQSALLADENRENDYIISRTLILVIIVMVSLSFIEIIAIFILGAHNMKKYNAWWQQFPREHNLSERYQLAENIRTTKQLAPVFVLHFANTALSVPIPVINFYKFLDNPPLIRALLYVYYFCCSTNYALTEFAILRFYKMIPISSFLGFSIYEAISIPLYLRIIYVLFTGKEFKYPFFRFLCVIGVLEICHYVIDVVFYRLPMFGPTVDLFDKSPSRILSVVPFLIYFLNYPIYVLHIAITLNRFSGIWVPVKQAKFWQRYWVPIIIAAFLISFCFTFHRIFTTSQMLPFVPSDPNKGYIPLIIKYDLYVIDTNLLTAVFNSFVFLFSLTVNGMTIYKVVQLNKSGMMNSAAQKAELNLLIIAIWMTVTLAVLIAFQLSLFMIRSGLLNNVLDVGETNYTLFLLQPLVEILGTESHPWVLITMSSAIRNAALPFWAGLSKKVFKDKQSTTKVIPSGVGAQTNKIGAGTVSNLNIRQVKVSG